MCGFTVTTRYSGATDTRGSRIVVRVTHPAYKARQKTYPFDYAANNAHIFAARQFCDELGIDLPKFARMNRADTGYEFNSEILNGWEH